MKKTTFILLSAFFLTIQSFNAQNIQLDSGLVAYYPFNGNALDESGNGNNGTVYDAQLTTDRFGNEDAAFWFNGINSHIQIPDSESLDIISEISITGWMKKDSNVPWASMLTKGGEFGEENNYTLHNSTDSSVIFTSYNESGGGGICVSSIYIPSSEWHFVAFTWDGTTAKLFVDGIADTSSFIAMEGEFQANNSILYIGVDYPGGTEYFHGSLDDIRIYNRWLSEWEILALLNDNPYQQTQSLFFLPGFQFTSSHIIPENPDMLVVLEEILEEELNFVRDSEGKMLQKIGPNWVNGIGDWETTEGYLFNLYESASITVEGTQIDPQTPIFLYSGYQFVGYLPDAIMVATDAFATIMNDSLDFVRDSNGSMLRKIGPQWINNIGEVYPGEGYLIRMIGPDELIYP